MPSEANTERDAAAIKISIYDQMSIDVSRISNGGRKWRASKTQMSTQQMENSTQSENREKKTSSNAKKAIYSIINIMVI